MKNETKFTVATAALALALSSGTAFGKAHDQGVADGEATPDNTGAFVQSLEGNGVSDLVSGGARGDAASSAGGDNRVEPTVGEGENAE